MVDIITEATSATATEGQKPESEGPNLDALTKVEELIVEDIRSTASKRNRVQEVLKSRAAMFKSELPQRQYAGRANIRIPFPYTWVQSMTPRYMGAIFNGSEVIDAHDRLGGNYEGAEDVRILLNHQLLFEMNFFWNAFMYHQCLSSTGFAIQKCRWNDKRQTGELHLIHPNEFTLDPRSSSVQDAIWLAHQVGKTKQDLIDGALSGKYLKTTVDQLIASDPVGMLQDGTKLSKHRATYPVWEWWGEADIGDGNGVQPVIALLAGKEDKLLAVRPSPYGDLKPFVGTSDVPDTWSFLDGMSELDPMESMYEGASDIASQRMDNTTMNINGFWTYRKQTGLNLDKLVSSPWGILGVDDHEDLKRWPVENVTQDAYQEVASMVDLMKLSSGLEDVLRGARTPGEKTAEEVGKIFESASVRPGLKIQMSQYMYVKRLAEILLAEDRMFLTEQKAAMILKSGTRATRVLKPQALEGSWEIMPQGFALTGDTRGRVGDLNNTLNFIRGVPGYEGYVNLILKEIMYLNNVRFTPEQLQTAMAPAIMTAGPEQQQQPSTHLSEQVGDERSTTGPVGVDGLANVLGQTPTGAPEVPLQG